MICGNCIHDGVCGLEGHLDEALTFCADKVTNVQPVDRWISTKDRMPDVGQPVLIYYPYWDGTEVQAARLEYDKLFFEICGEFNVSVKKVTHWQPLPVPPKD